MVKKLVLLRHGQSEWNLENRFTGWTDVDLTAKGREEAFAAGKLMLKSGLVFDKAFTSYLTRAIKTLNLALEAMNQLWLPVEKTWRLNEKHYGALQGLNKADTAAKYGAEQVLLWRRAYDVRPPALTADDPRHPRFEARYRGIAEETLPATESLKDCIGRLIPYWENTIVPALTQNDRILIAAHGNSLRGVVKILKNIPDDKIVGLNIPTGAPYVFELDEDLNLIKDYYLGDPDEIARRAQAVADQAKAK